MGHVSAFKDFVVIIKVPGPMRTRGRVTGTDRAQGEGNELEHGVTAGGTGWSGGSPITVRSLTTPDSRPQSFSLYDLCYVSH